MGEAPYIADAEPSGCLSYTSYARRTLSSAFLITSWSYLTRSAVWRQTRVTAWNCVMGAGLRNEHGTSMASLFHDFSKLPFTGNTFNLVFRTLGDWHCQKGLVNNHFTSMPTSSSNVFRFIFIFRLRGGCLQRPEVSKWSKCICKSPHMSEGDWTRVFCKSIERS